MKSWDIRRNIEQEDVELEEYRRPSVFAAIAFLKNYNQEKYEISIFSKNFFEVSLLLTTFLSNSFVEISKINFKSNETLKTSYNIFGFPYRNVACSRSYKTFFLL